MKGARINFGVPNSEYVLLADDDGVAVSLKNQDTDTEYIGGGGGGDFSTATVTISNAAGHSINVGIPYIDFDYNDIEALMRISMDVILEHTIPLYKGRATLYFDLNTESIALTGDLTDDGGGFIIVAGNGTITIS